MALLIILCVFCFLVGLRVGERKLLYHPLDIDSQRIGKLAPPMPNEPPFCRSCEDYCVYECRHACTDSQCGCHIGGEWIFKNTHWEWVQRP